MTIRLMTTVVLNELWPRHGDGPLEGDDLLAQKKKEDFIMLARVFMMYLKTEESTTARPMQTCHPGMHRENQKERIGIRVYCRKYGE